MSNEPLVFSLPGEDGEVEYRMTLGNALRSWSVLKKAGKLFKGIGGQDIVGKDQKVDKSKAMLAVLDAVLDNAGSAEVLELENLVYANTVVVPSDGSKPYKLFEQRDAHFNKYRSHIFEVLKNGLVFQFADFFKGNGLSVAGLVIPSMASTTEQ